MDASTFSAKHDLAALAAAFAQGPQGRLRASINLGNPILAGRDASGAPAGVSIDLARALAEVLGRELELVVWETAAESVKAVESGAADFGFFAIDPKRAEHIAFTTPYVLIEGSYLVREDSPIQINAQVDRAGQRVTVGQGSAYDLFLTREIQNATLERAPSSPAVVPHFLEHGHDVAAGVRQQLEADARRLGGLRLLPGHFMLIRQAMGVHRSRGEAAAAFLTDFVEAMKASNAVAQALQRHGIEGASVAPAGG